MNKIHYGNNRRFFSPLPVHWLSCYNDTYKYRKETGLRHRGHPDHKFYFSQICT
ncbi:hypothetical protein HMPREF3213_03530 [Heyndrickxia coagulans]|uniref:Uncharacterized protein n=1 Tax=Heyndrickxia coagulans TaxID=1398 RepID=A0A133KBM9_HEYCO|nr:hypothetical protein HMPREF3213_03530 [Heyndrickxia coagulans]